MKTPLTIILGFMLSAVLWEQAWAQGTTAFTYLSDSSWKVTDAEPAAGWNSNQNFDDSSWQAASVRQVAPFGGDAPGVPQPGWLWSTPDIITSVAPPVWFRKTIEIGSTPTFGTMDVAADDDIDLYINGSLVLHDTNGYSADMLGTDVTSYLHKGSNLIAAQVWDRQAGGQIFIFRLHVDASPPTNNTPTIQITGNQVQVCWVAASNTTYRVEVATNSLAGQWQVLTNNIIGTGSVFCVMDPIPPADRSKFYRVIPYIP